MTIIYLPRQESDYGGNVTHIFDRAGNILSFTDASYNGCFSVVLLLVWSGQFFLSS